MFRKACIVIGVLTLVSLYSLSTGSVPVIAVGGPHEGAFAFTTDACAGCHRTHAGANTGKLLKGSTQVALCNSCHDGNGANTDVINGVYQGNTNGTNNAGLRGGGFTNALMNTGLSESYDETGAPAVVTSKHDVGSSSLTAWGSGIIGSGPGESVTLECGNCHNPHGNGNYRILRPKPTSLSGWESLDAVAIADETIKNYTIVYDTDNYRDINEYSTSVRNNISVWCSQCHTRYEAYGNSGSTDSGDEIFKYRHMTSANCGGCFRCHVAHGSSAIMLSYAGETLWPDSSTSPSGNARSSLLHLDNRGVCSYCHISGSGEVIGHGGGGNCGNCHGSSGSHDVHTTGSTRGPAVPLVCIDCHETDNYYSFADGNDLASTAVCDPCHSPGGTYDGVNDPVIGAKANWISGVYTGGTLQNGKEQWCVGCHDDAPATISGVSAPDVSLFWSDGHGSAGIDCEECHNIGTTTHIDGTARTYEFDISYYAPAESGVAYAAGYRLKYVASEVPLMIPANYSITFNYNAQTMKENAFRLCFDSCHNQDNVFDDTPGDGINSNFKASAPNPPRDYSYAWGSGADVNEHVSHILNYTGPFWDSDWGNSTTGAGGQNGRDSLTACSACHNVHGAIGTEGSSNEAMIRDGRLAGRTGYGFSYVIEHTVAGGYPMVTSTGATRDSSVGAIFRRGTETTLTDSMCGGSMCHGTPAPPSGSGYDATGSSWGTFLEFFRPPGDYTP